MWEYSIEDFIHPGSEILDIQFQLDAWGKKGWELVTILYIQSGAYDTTRVFLKRPTQEHLQPSVTGENLLADFRG